MVIELNRSLVNSELKIPRLYYALIAATAVSLSHLMLKFLEIDVRENESKEKPDQPL